MRSSERPSAITKLKLYRRSILIVSTTVGIDLIGRVAFNFEIRRVVPLEAVLFLLSGVLLFSWAAHRDKMSSLRASRIDLWLGLVFGLGGIRALLWTVGVPIPAANLMILGLGVVLGILIVIRSRRIDGQSLQGDRSQ